MKARTFTILVVALLPLAWAGACVGAQRIATVSAPDVQALRSSLAPYTSFALAKNAGYATAITDCMSNGDEGAMGVHYGNPGLIDGVTDALHPEVLIYEPGASGALSLVGVEFVVPFAVIPKSSTPPTLFGQHFIPNDVFGLWTLHVWTQRSNPAGLFASWNPRLHC